MAPQELNATESGFQAAWPGTDLGDFRPSQHTYQGYDMDSLPPLPVERFDGSLGWLGDPGEALPKDVAEMDQISAALGEAGLTLPDDFVKLLTHENLRRALDRVSCTACWTYVSGPFVSPVDPADRLVMFFRDQQDCVIWYLYLRPGKDGASTESFVVHSYRQLEYEEELRAEGRLDEVEETVDSPSAEFFWCAPSTEQFAFRFWVEGRLWFALSGDSDEGFDADMEAYVAHYRRAQELEQNRS